MHSSIQGSLLIAQPGLVDPNFRCSVVLITEHDENGAFGLLLNRRGEHRIADLWSSLTGQSTAYEGHAFHGGPVGTSTVFLLHSYEDLEGDSERILPGLYLGSTIELFRELLGRESRAGAEGKVASQAESGSESEPLVKASGEVSDEDLGAILSDSFFQQGTSLDGSGPSGGLSKLGGLQPTGGLQQTGGSFFRVFCGYAGWGAGQLDRELADGGWVVQRASRSVITGTRPEVLWQEAMERQGGFYRFFSLMPQDPDRN